MTGRPTIYKPPYKSSVGSWHTVSLFHETRYKTAESSREAMPNPIFSLYDDIPGLINCQKTFIELRDPTGYKWATKYLKDWRHWVKLCELPWFQKALTVWQTALQMELKSEAIQKIILIASEDSSQALPAAKYIAEEGWVPKGSSARGRPSQEEIKANLKNAMKAAATTDEDAERIGLKLKVITGGKNG